MGATRKRKKREKEGERHRKQTDKCFQEREKEQASTHITHTRLANPLKYFFHKNTQDTN